MRERALALLGTLALLTLPGCPGAECGRAICGCWEEVRVELDLVVVDQFDEPVEGVDVVCINEDTPIASTDDEGVVDAEFDTRLSAACGTERCNSLTLIDPTGRCQGSQSTLAALNATTITLVCDAGDDDDSAR